MAPRPSPYSLSLVLCAGCSLVWKQPLWRLYVLGSLGKLFGAGQVLMAPVALILKAEAALDREARCLCEAL